MKRGIITNTAVIKRKDSESISLSSTISPVDLNYYLLYWDKIIMPTNNMFHLTVPNEDELIKSGVFERPRVQFDRWFSYNTDAYYDPFIVSQSVVANNLISSKSDIDWSIHQIGDQVVIANNQQREFQSLKFELLECLPVPAENLKPDLILEFKNKRKDELLELHRCIDNLYLEILKSPDPDLQKKISKSELEAAVQNLEKTSIEYFSFLSKYNFTTEININGKDVVKAAATGAVIDFFSNGLAIPVATILSGLGSMINIKANKTTSVESTKNKLNLSFLAKASKKGIIQK